MENASKTAHSATDSADNRVLEADLLRRTVDAGLRGRIARLESQVEFELDFPAAENFSSMIWGAK